MTDKHIRTVQPIWLEVLPIKDTAQVREYR